MMMPSPERRGAVSLDGPRQALGDADASAWAATEAAARFHALGDRRGEERCKERAKRVRSRCRPDHDSEGHPLMNRSSTRRRTSALIVATALASALALVSAGSASAAPPVGLEAGLVIQTDSVMAAARVPYNGDPNSVSVTWGDGKTTLGAQGTPASGVLLFTHQYAVSADKFPFIERIDVHSGGEAAARFVQVVPRWTVVKGVDYFSPLAECDSSVESTTEWRVTQEVHQSSIDGPLLSSKEFHFVRANRSNLELRAISGSGYAAQMSMTDPTLLVSWHVVELDPVLDDLLFPLYIEMHPRDAAQTPEIYFGEFFGGDCKAEIKTFIHSELLTPQITLPAPPPTPTPTTTTPAAPPPAPTTTIPAPTTTAPPPPPPPTTAPPACPPPANPRNCQEN
jgi:hypothetical protein